MLQSTDVVPFRALSQQILKIHNYFYKNLKNLKQLELDALSLVFPGKSTENSFKGPAPPQIGIS